MLGQAKRGMCVWGGCGKQQTHGPFMNHKYRASLAPVGFWNSRNLMMLNVCMLYHVFQWCACPWKNDYCCLPPVFLFFSLLFFFSTDCSTVCITFISLHALSLSHPSTSPTSANTFDADMLSLHASRDERAKTPRPILRTPRRAHNPRRPGFVHLYFSSFLIKKNKKKLCSVQFSSSSIWAVCLCPKCLTIPLFFFHFHKQTSAGSLFEIRWEALSSQNEASAPLLWEEPDEIVWASWTPPWWGFSPRSRGLCPSADLGVHPEELD